MRILIISDNHGERDVCREASELQRCDLNIHLGDSEFNYNDQELSNFLKVGGNVDTDPAFPQEDYHNEAEVFFTHGHLYGIKESRNQLAKRAHDYISKFALYGHSHVAKVEKIDNIFCINPGSISASRSDMEESYVVLDLYENICTFFNRYHKEIEAYHLDDWN